MAIILPANTLAAGGYTVDNSCRFNDADSSYMNFTQGTPTNNKKWTWSAWVKFARTGEQYFMASYVDANNNTSIRFLDATGRLDFQNYVSAGDAGRLKTTRNLRDPSAWYHIVCVFDSDNSTAGNRQQIWINGVRETAFHTETYPSSGAASIINADTRVAELGRRSDTSNMFDGYLAEAVFIDGQALTPTSFGEFDEDSPTIWKPKNVSGLTFGNNGYYCDFEDSADLGKDVSGESNNFTEVNLAATDQCTDTPTNNFPTWNPLIQQSSGFVLSEGNTTADNTNDAWRSVYSTFAPSVGKWYIECKIVNQLQTPRSIIGVCSTTQASNASARLGHEGTNAYAYGSDGKKINNSTHTSYGNTFATNDIISCALDLDNGKIYFGKNGTWQNAGDPTSGATGTNSAFDVTLGEFYYFGSASYGNEGIISINSGSPSYANSSDAADADGYGKFEYAPPTGYFALCTKNLAEYG